MESTEKAQASIKSEFSKEVSLEADFPREIKSEDFRGFLINFSPGGKGPPSHSPSLPPSNKIRDQGFSGHL